MDKFIYVFTDENKQLLLSQGYTLLKSDIEREMYVFENKETLNFSLSQSDYICSNILTF